MNKKSQSGAAIVELTIVLVFVLIPLLLAVLEFARLMYAYKTLVHQVNHTARYLSVQLPGLNHDKAICLLKTGQAVAPCSAADDLLKAFGDADFQVLISDSSNSALHAQWETSTLAVSSHINLVTVSAQNFSYSFDFSKLFGDLAIKFSPVSATYRQVN
ncbi:TadE/TadG family type IV pilus assembly protein [Limnohabitans sp.]